VFSRSKLFQVLGYTPNAGQEQIHAALDTHSRVIGLFGRQAGKTTSAVHETIYQALNDNWLIYIVSDTYAHAYKPLELIYLTLQKSPLSVLIRRFYRGQNPRLELVNGTRIVAKSADNPSSLAGDSVHFVVIDESGFVPDEAVTVLEPALARHSAKVLAIGTPDSRNWYHTWYQRGITGNNSYYSINAPTAVNQTIPRSEIERARDENTDKNFRKYYLAEFVDDEGAIFPNDLVDRVTLLATPTGYKAGTKYIAGVDLADKVDYTVVSILDASVKPFKLVHVDRFNKLGWEVTTQRVAETLKSWKAKALVDETGVGNPILESIKRQYPNIEGFTFTNKSKQDLIENLELSFERNEIALFKHPALDSELRSLRAKYLKTGIHYGAPDGLHDDTVFSLALANYQARLSPSITITNHNPILR
jgi:Terminase large subunit, T4likevirus-type, N-terminal